VAHDVKSVMCTREVTGSLVIREGKRGTVIYAKLRTPEPKWIRLGRLWEGKGRPAAGYLTKPQAEVRLDAIKHGDDPLVNVQPTRALFSDAVDAWLSDRGRELRSSTMHDYRGVAKTLKGYFSGPLASIDTDALNAFSRAPVGSGSLGADNEQDADPSSRRLQARHGAWHGRHEPRSGR
jgi:hypothetical protein